LEPGTVAAGDGNGSIRIDRRADGDGAAALEETIELRQRSGGTGPPIRSRIRAQHSLTWLASSAAGGSIGPCSPW
jgi:hypothetical protein